MKTGRQAVRLAASLALLVIITKQERVYADVSGRVSVNVSFEPMGLVSTECAAAPMTGCTKFGPVVMFCDCAAELHGWRISARAGAVARVFVVDRRYIVHELLHVADLRHALESHVALTNGTRYADKAECEDAAAAAVNEFPDIARKMIAASAAYRDKKK